MHHFDLAFSTPAALDSEQVVLAGVLVEPDTICSVIDLLAPEDFIGKGHSEIYQAVYELFRMGEKHDVIYVSEMLKDLGTLEEAGGRAYIMELASSHLTGTAIPYHAKRVKSKATARKVQSLLLNTLPACNSEDGCALVESLMRELLEVSGDIARREAIPVAELVDSAVSRAEDRLNGKKDLSIMAYGLPSLDSMTGGGLHQDDYVLLAARPSVGKSALMLHFALNVALQQGKPVLILSLEMTADRLMDRMLYAEGRGFAVSSRIQEAGNRIRQAKIHINDRMDLNPIRLRAAIMRHIAKYGRSLVIIDYLQLMESEGENENIRLTALSRAIKKMTREFRIPIIALSQLNRAPEARADKKPTSADLRGSGALEQDADVVLLMHSEDPDHQTVKKVILTVSKQRNGPKGAVSLNFDGQISKFVEI